MIKLQPLRIPTGWKMSYNKLLEIEPNDLKEDDCIWMHFTQDILQMQYKYKENELIIDVGWYPELEIDGIFRLVLIKNQDWDSPIEIFESRSKAKMVEVIEKLIEDISEGYKYI